MAKSRQTKQRSLARHSRVLARQRRERHQLLRRDVEGRRPQMELLEDRHVMATAPPVFILPNNGALLNQGETRTVAPRDLTFRFTQLSAVDPTTLGTGIVLQRAGHDGVFGDPNDVTINPGFIGLGTNSREVVMRFAENLPDDIYRVIVVGSGATPLRDANGAAFNGGTDFELDFRLDLGAQIVAIVPQPVTRQPNGTLTQARNQIVVYFNDDDLDVASAQQLSFYRLYVTHNTLDPADDEEILPTEVVYDPTTDTATLTFGQVAALEQFAPDDGSSDPAKSFRLRVGTDEQRRPLTTTTRLEFSDPGSSFATAFDVGNSITAGTQGASAAYAQSIDPQFIGLSWTGDGTDPGHRDIPATNHLSTFADGSLAFAPDSTTGITTVFYNFQDVLGTIPDGQGGSQVALNFITEAEKQRAREIFELYAKYSGVQFVETADQGLTVATGDMRVINPLVSTGPNGAVYQVLVSLGLDGLLIMNNAITWNDQFGFGSNPPGPSWFDTAMSGIGQMLGLGNTWELPPHSVTGEDGRLLFPGTATPSPGGEPVFPGDGAITHMQVTYRPESKDIDMYRFVLDGTGVFSAETFAERLPDSSNLDTSLTLYRQNANGTRELIARNDDYFSKDSYLQLVLGPGTYFVGLSASGNDQYDPTVEDSGIGGRTQGEYEIKFDFRKSASQGIVDAVTPASPATQPLIADTLAVPFDGDSDGNAGGVYNFWFRAAAPSGSQAAGKARTIFVDKAAASGGTGSLAAPFNNIGTALTAAQPFDIVRIVGNGGADGNIDTLADNLAYRIGFDEFGQPLADGVALNVPKDVTVMIDAGTIIQMRRSAISVGSTAPSIASDRSGGALQVLGIPGAETKPGRSVYFTSYNEVGPNSIGVDTNPLNTPPAPGDWGGISFTSDLDRADGRFEHDSVGVFLNYVNHADIRYGGGQVNVNSVFEVVTPVDMTDSRPTVSYNLITRSADAAMSANPDSFEETNYQAPKYWPRFSNTAGYDPSGVFVPPPSASFTLDYKRVGPEIHGNTLVQRLPGGGVVSNSTNGLFIRTSTPAGDTLEELTVAGRFDDTDIVHVLQENLVVRGTPGGPYQETVPPPTDLIVPTVVAGGNFSAAAGAATTVQYKLVFADLAGNEGVASQTISQPLVPGTSGNAVQLDNLPMPGGEFVARRLYRRVLVSGQPAGEFTLVDQVPAQVTTFVDRNLPQTGALHALKVLSSSIQRARLDASLAIDPSIVVKSDGARIEVGMGAQFLAEAQAGQETIFTSLFDDRYGAGSTFDTPSDNFDAVPKVGAAGDWGGLYFSPNSTASLDHVRVAFGGGLNRVEGTFAGFNPIEIDQANVRIANSEFERNANGQGGTAPSDRFGRGFNADAVIFVRGAQPVVVNNLIHDNAAAFANINVNALNSDLVVDLGRQSGLIDRVPGHLDNNGPLIDNNRLSNNATNGMIVRGGTLTTEGVWDDTDVVHVLFSGVNIADFHTFGGLRLESSPTESLVVKAQGTTAGITATGRPLEIDDRAGGILQVLGQPGFPVVMTSFTDDTVGAGIRLDGAPQTDTDGNGFGNGLLLPTGPEVANGTLIDNDTLTTTVGHLEVRPGAGGSITGAAVNSGATVQGQTLLLTNQDFLNEFINYIDVGAPGAAFDLASTTIVTPPTLSPTTPDLVFSAGTFNGANGVVNWRLETRINNGVATAVNTLTLTSVQPLGALRFINYLDQNVLVANDDLLYQVGSPGQPNFRLITLDNAQRVGYAQGGVYTPGPSLVNATYSGFAADKFQDLRTAITGPGANFLPTGLIDTVDLPPFSDPALGAVNGLADVTTAMSWLVNPSATTATITTFLDLVARPPLSAGRPGDWQGLTIDQWAHDRNVATILEREAATSSGAANSTPSSAQVLGQLATGEKGSDENLRLGFTVHGVINNAADQDVYSFEGKAGTEVWIDIDRTTAALDTVVELIDNLGNVLARSNDSPAESNGANSLAGIALKMQKTPPYEGTDYYTTNPSDGGMRLVLPGPANTTNTYFIRVRSNGGASVAEAAQGSSGTVTELVPGGPIHSVELITANNPQTATLVQGGAGTSLEVVRGGAGFATETIAGNSGTITTVVNGQTGNVTQALQGGSQYVTEVQRGGSGQVQTLIQGGAGAVTEVVKGSNAVAATVMRGNSPSVAVLQQGGGGQNEEQALGFIDQPTGGTFALSFNGQTTAQLPFNASASDVQFALENLNNIALGDVAVSFLAGTWTVTFQGAYADQDVAELIGISDEIQEITLPAAADFTLNFNGQFTSVLSAASTAAQVQTALELLNNINPGDIAVSGSAGGPYQVRFTGGLANTHFAPIAVNSREIELVSVPAAAAGGQFRLTFNGQPTSPIDPFTADGAAVQLQLIALPNINNGDVFVTGPVGGPWDVSFSGAYAGQDVPDLTVTVNERQRVTLSGSTGGTFTLDFGGQKTNPIAFNAAIGTVDAQLELLPAIGPGGVTVTGAAGNYVVEFSGVTLANADQVPLVLETNEFQRVTNPVPLGALTLSFGGQVTAPIPGTADGAAVQAALAALPAIGAGNVAVTGAAGGPWLVEFRGPLAKTNVQPLAVHATEIMPGGGLPITTAVQGGSGVVTEVVKGGNATASELIRGNGLVINTTVPGGGVNEQQTVAFAAAPSGGTFNLTFNGQTTAQIPFFAAAGLVQTALENLSNINPGDVLVSGNPSGPWTITFQGAFANSDVPQLTGTINELQRITNPNAGGSFTLAFNGQFTPVMPATATAAQIQTELAALSTIGAGNVSVSGPIGGPWDVQFTGGLANTNVNPIAINSREIQRFAFTTAPTGGTFKLQFNASQTIAIATNAPAIDVQAALSLIGLNTAVTGSPGGPYDITFLAPLAAQDVPALAPIVNEIQFINQQTATGGSFQLTFNGQQTAAIPVGSTASFVQNALELLSNINPGDVAVSLSGGVYAVQFQGAFAGQNVVQMTSSSQEVQRITPSFPGNALTINFGGQVTGIIPAGATAGTVQQALENLSNINPGDISVAPAVGPVGWVVTFLPTGAYANTNVPQMIVSDSEIQTVALPAVPAGSTFTLAFGGQTTGAIPTAATAAEVQSALEALSTIGAGNVAVSGPVGGPWNVAFQGLLGSQDVSPLVAGINEAQTITLTGTPTGGAFRLTFTDQASNAQTTAAIPFNATAATVQAELENLSNLSAGDVAVSGAAGGPWTVTFLGALSGINQNALAVTVNEVQRITNPIPGSSLTLSLNGLSTAAIPGNSDGSAVQAALEAVLGAGAVAVTGPAGGPWDVQFTGSLANSNVNLLIVRDSEVMRGGGPPIATAMQGGGGSATETVKGGSAVALELMEGNNLVFATTVPGGAAVNEQQTFHFGSPPSAGTFTLTFNGESTGPLAFNAPAATVQAALQGLSTIGPGNVTVGLAGGTWTVTFQGGLANTDVSPLTGRNNEVQSVPAQAGSFTLNFNGQSTTPLAAGASAAQVQAALEVLSNIGNGNVTVTGAAGGPWAVEFTGGLANQNFVPLAINDREIQTIALAGPPTAGQFTLSLGAQTTAALAFNATPGDVQSALEALPAIGAGNVLVSAGAAASSWQVFFRGSLGGQDVPLLGIQANEVQQIDLRTTSAGTYALVFGAETTVPLAFNAPAATVQSALEGLNAIAPGDVAVTTSGGIVSITFQGAFANSNVAQLTASANEIQRVIAPTGGSQFTLTFDGQATAPIANTATAGDLQAALEALSNIQPGDVLVSGPPGGPWNVEFTGVYADQDVPQMSYNDSEVQRLSLAGAPAGGTFTLTFNGQTTQPLPVTALASDVQAELANLTTIGAGNVSVSGPAGGPWDVTFRGALLGQNVPLIAVNVNELQSITLQGSPTGGEFTLTFNGQKTNPIAFNANAATVQMALENLSNINTNDVSVSSPAPGVWLVTFIGAFGNQNVVQLTANSNEFQQIVSPVTGGALTLSFAGQTTSLLPPGATPAQVQTALENLSNINPGDVLVTSAGIVGKDAYNVEFRGQFANQPVPEITILDVQVMQANAVSVTTPQQGSGGQNERQLVTLAAGSVGGTFRLTFSGQTTAPIAFNAGPAGVQAALAALSNINGAANVLVTGNPTGPWTVEFRGALANLNVAQMTGSSNEVQRVTTGVPGVAFALTFNGQTTAIIPANATALQVQQALEALGNIGAGNVAVTGINGGPWDVEFRGVFAGQNVAAMAVGQDETQRVALPVVPGAGTFTLSFQGQTTAAIPVGATAADVQAALVALSTVGAGNVQVTGNPGGPWDVRFTGTLSQTNVPALVASINEVQRVTLLGNPTGGTFTLTFGGETTAPLAFNAPASAVQAALVALNAFVDGDVVVTGNAGGPYDISFQQNFANVNVPALSVNSDALVGGLTSGAYQLQLRLREVDEIAGSTIQFASIRNAVNGIRVLGQPTHSPLAGEYQETVNANDTRATSQVLGNLLNSDRGEKSIGGSISGPADTVDWYQLDVTYDAVTINRNEDWWSTIFDIDYADGLARPNLTVNLYNSTGNLILTSRDSNVADDRPTPLAPTDLSDLSRGSLGTADPWIGPVELPQGRYFVAITTDTSRPQEFDQFTSATPLNAGIRLEPVNSVQRLVEDHIGSDGGMTGSPPVTLGFTDANSIIPWNLNDVTMFVTRDTAPTANQTQVLTVDPFMGLVETTVGSFGQNVGDLAINPSTGGLFVYQVANDNGGNGAFADAAVGQFYQINPGTGASTLIGDDGIQTYELDPTAMMPTEVLANNVNNVRVGEGVAFRAVDISQYSGTSFPNNPFAGGLGGLAIGGRDPRQTSATGVGSLPQNGNDSVNILYAFNPATGAASSIAATDFSGLARATNAAATQIVARAVLNTATDINPSGNRDVIATAEATIVTGGVTTFNIRDGAYPFPPILPEIPLGNPSPTTFQVNGIGPNTTFEFDAGSEGILTVDPLSPSGRQLRDGDLITVNGTQFVFDTGPVVVTSTGTLANYPAGSVLQITDVDPDPANLTGLQRTPLNYNFEFTQSGVPMVGTNIPIFTGDTPSAQVLATRIATAINLRPGISIKASVIPGTSRLTLENNTTLFPNIAPVSDGNAVAMNGLPATNIVGAIGVPTPASQVQIRVEETTPQAQLGGLLAAAIGTMPLNTVAGVSGAINVGRVTIGFDGDRLNFSGATSMTTNIAANRQVLNIVNNNAAGVTAGRTAVPFLAQDDANMIAQRMVAAAGAVGFSNATVNGAAFVVPGSTVTNVDAPLASASQAPGGTITGMAVLNDNANPPNQEVYVVTDTGGLFRVVNPFSTNAQLDYIDGSQGRLAAGGGNIEFSGLTRGPQTVEGNRYARMLFGTDQDGMLYAFDPQGNPQDIFTSTFNASTNQIEAQSRIQMRQANGNPITQVNGVRFSTLDRNLWHVGAEQGTVAGHGILAPFDRSRTAVQGGSALHFGRGPNSDIDAQSPGGSHGTVETNTFSLKGYSATDQPVLYFNYFMETEGTNHTAATPMRDSFRVFISGDDGVWHMLTTNDGGVVAGSINDDFDYSNPRPIEIFDNPQATPAWRQARVPLVDFAGQDNLKLRFDFSTAGSMNLGHIQAGTSITTPTVGDELRAVDGIYLRDQQSFTLTSPGGPSDLTFQFDMGYTLVAPNGAAIPNGAQFTVDGQGFEFRSSGIPTPGFSPVFFSPSDSPTVVAQLIRNAIGFLTPVQINGNRLNLRGGAPGAVTGATNVTAVNMPGGFIEGAPGVSGSGIGINVHSGMSRDQVREAIALVLAQTYAQGVRAQIKTQNEIVKLIGFDWVSQFAGPFNDLGNPNQAGVTNQRLLGITTSLPGDDWGAFNSNLRGQANAGVEGIYVDDIIVGFAERGEMITGSNGNNSFIANPGGSSVQAGQYQLQIRRGPETGLPFGASPPTAVLDLLPSIDTNDRLKPALSLIARPGNQVADGDIFTLTDGINQVTFEFNDTTVAPALGVQPGRTRIDFNPRMRDYEVAQAVRAAINSAPVQAVLDVEAQLSDGVQGSGSTANVLNLIGPVSITTAFGIDFRNFQTTINDHYGDDNTFRDQGQIILLGNEVTNSSQWGILIDDNPRNAADGSASHEGPVFNGPQINSQRQIPGVVVMNNVLASNALGGIRYSGDPGADAPVSFGRIVNNTLFGLGGTLTNGATADVGIRVDENSAPTILNNIIANFNQSINVDATSGGTVLGGNLYQGNRNIPNVPDGNFPITLTNTQPLFVNSTVGNFYLKAQSPAIDSSVDSLLDRPGLVTVKSPLAIAPSPILSPDRDGVGQLRVDDPSVATPNGFGLNPFKDRGAIDRVDFAGPSSQLTNPLDNDAAGVDRDSTPTIVVLQNQILTDFSISLVDRTDPNGPVEGSDIDDSSVNANQVTVEALGTGTPVTLVQGVDYSFSYDTTNNLIRLTPLGGLWPLSQTYRITLNNAAAGGISDNAGNALQANQTDGSHRYLIFLGTAVDFGDAPDTYGTLLASNGASHQILGNFHLGLGESADPDGQPSAAADLDADDGITFGNLLSGGGPGSSQIFATASAPGKLDAWFDLNNNGNFNDAGEHVLQAVSLAGTGNPEEIRFQLGDGIKGNTYARFRFTSAGISTPTGPADDGEVEDYRVLLVGPQFQNPVRANDVNNDGIVSPIDALLGINYISFLNSQLIVPGGNLPLPITSPPYLPTTAQIDPTGGGVAGQGRFLDVNGDGFLSNLDVLIVINELNNPAASPEGEAEGEGPSAPSASPARSLQPAVPAQLLAGPGIEYEVRETATAASPAAIAASALQSRQSAQLELDLLAQDQAARQAGQRVQHLGDALNLTAGRPYGPLSEAAWEDLLEGLADDGRDPPQAA